MTRPPCLDDPDACRPGDCWCACWESAAEPLPVVDEPEPPARPIHDVPIKGTL